MLQSYPLDNRKKIPSRVLVFGAGGHLGGPVAETLRQIAPDIKLRLATSSAEKLPALAAKFPGADTVVADLFDRESLKPALEGVEGLWIVTPDFTDEIVAMGNLTEVACDVTKITHAVRIAGDIPGLLPPAMRPFIRTYGPRGAAMQHHVAAEILQANLPTTIVNGVYYFDNFTRYFGWPIRNLKTLILPFNLRIGFIDPTDIGIFVAHLLASDNHRHINQKYTMDNGVDVHRFSEVMELMSEVLGETINFIADPALFLEKVGPQINEMTNNPDAARYFVENWYMEYENDVVFRKSDVFEFVTGRKGKTLRQWFSENRTQLLG
jgi:uncharacterized protein YbjT (DUF2867 family)